MVWPCLRAAPSFLIFLVLSVCPVANAAKRSVLKKSPTREITVGIHKLNVEVAETAEQRRKGLMFRTSWGRAEGMLFIFPDSSPRKFWMRNTLLKISIGFFNDLGILEEKADLNPPQKSLTQRNVDSITSKGRAKYVLEVPQGWFKDKGIKLGTKLKFGKQLSLKSGLLKN